MYFYILSSIQRPGLSLARDRICQADAALNLGWISPSQPASQSARSPPETPSLTLKSQPAIASRTRVSCCCFALLAHSADDDASKRSCTLRLGMRRETLARVLAIRAGASKREREREREGEKKESNIVLLLRRHRRSDPQPEFPKQTPLHCGAGDPRPWWIAGSSPWPPRS